MDNKDLYDWAKNKDIEIIKYRIKKNKSLSVQIGNKNFIGLDYGVSDNSADERSYLAHEIGHCETGSFYNIYSPLDVRAKHEFKANKWAVLRCVPKNELIRLIKRGYKQNEIAEHFGVTEKMIKLAYTYYFEYGIAG